MTLVFFVPRLTLFLSTPSARRATYELEHPGQPQAISIHALREEGDVSPRGVSSGCGKFLSTPSARRATVARPFIVGPQAISIHALREEGDLRSWNR